MRNFAFLSILLLCISANSFSQNSDDAQSKRSANNEKFLPSFDFAVGFAPKKTYNAPKVDFEVNNFFLKRFGAYASFEKGLDTNYFSAILGLTTHIDRRFYLWYGLGYFSHYQTRSNGDWNTFRKEVGIGVIPFDNFVVKAGWSKTVGTTVAIGYRFLIKKNNRTVKENVE
jgi:hypothetical protein